MSTMAMAGLSTRKTRAPEVWVHCTTGMPAKAACDSIKEENSSIALAVIE
jgi:hypothetical protein